MKKVFQSLVPLLVDALPQTIAASKVPNPICVVRLYYFDTHAPCTYLTLRTISENCRAGILSEKGRDALSYLWASSQESRDGDIDFPDSSASKAHSKIVELFKRVYDILCEDEEDGMVAFQRMLQQVSRKLNEKDWTTICKVTDDFVIAPADGSQCFAGDEDYNDLVNSLPPNRLALLRSRGLLGPSEDDWKDRPGF